jgi:serine/threonine protein kinase
VLALKYLHENEIIYRDLTLDNILLTVDGHIKLINFGIAKQCNLRFGNTTRTFCGNPENMAPEVVGLRGLADFSFCAKRVMDMRSIGGHLVSYSIK